MPPVESGSAIRSGSAVLAGSSNRHSSIRSATSEKTATLTPRPFQVAPRGVGKPRCTRIAFVLPRSCLRAVGRHVRGGTAAGDQVGDQGGPPGLVAGAEARAGVAVEVLEEQQLVAPLRVALQPLVVPEHRTTAVTLGDVGLLPFAVGAGGVAQPHPPTRAGGQLDGELVAEVAVEPGQGIDDLVVHGDPDGPPPVGVAAEHAGAGFAGLVVQPPDQTKNKQKNNMAAGD